MFRAFELRLKPNREQVKALEHVLRVSCELYNAALQERAEAWKLQRKSLTYYDQTRELTELRACDPETEALPIEIAREPLRRVNRAFHGFFRRSKAGQNPGYPRYKSRLRYDSFGMSGGFAIEQGYLRISRISRFRFKSHRAPTGTAKYVTVRRVGAKWIARVVCDTGPAPPRIPICSAVGVDLGLTVFATLSNGREIQNPRFVRQHTNRIARANRKLSRARRGSKNRLRAKEVLRRAYQRVADARKNFTHHISKQLIGQFDLIAHEDLKISQMVRGSFAKSIFDASWGQFLFQLAYKAESAGRHVVAVNPRGTTQNCSGCSALVKKGLADRQHTCSCGLSLSRDHNAALNVLALGRSAVEVMAEGPLKIK